MYEKEDLNEVAGTRSCQLMLSSIIEFLKTDLTLRDDGDIQLANVTYRQYFLNSINTNYASEYRVTVRVRFISGCFPPVKQCLHIQASYN